MSACLPSGLLIQELGKGVVKYKATAGGVSISYDAKIQIEWGDSEYKNTLSLPDAMMEYIAPGQDVVLLEAKAKNGLGNLLAENICLFNRTTGKIFFFYFLDDDGYGESGESVEKFCLVPEDGLPKNNNYKKSVNKLIDFLKTDAHVKVEKIHSIITDLVMLPAVLLLGAICGYYFFGIKTAIVAVVLGWFFVWIASIILGKILYNIFSLHDSDAKKHIRIRIKEIAGNLFKKAPEVL